MKPLPVFLTIFMLSLGLAAGAGASLIGDEVTLQYWENDILEDEQTFTIDAGPDNITTGFGTIRLDMTANEVVINFIRPNSYAPGNTSFFGIKLLGLDDVENPDWILLGADVTQNTMTSSALWYAEEDERLMIDPINGNISFDWNQMSYQTGQRFTAMLEFGPNPIPIPATMALFVTGLIGFILIRRRKKQS